MPGADEALPPIPVAPAPAFEAQWDPEVLAGLLEAKGAALHAIAGKGDDDWLYTQAELRAIAPPLARVLNRYPLTAAAAGSGDELAVLIGFGGYALRSIQTRRDALDAERAASPDDPEPLGAPVFSPEPPPAGGLLSGGGLST